jgi:3-hydroxybutyryl-CoA dehydrogenase
MHFMNPVPVMKLVEIIQGKQTSPQVTESIVRICEQLGKTPCVVRDAPGFIANRILLPMLNEAVFCLHEGIAGVETIDTIMRLGMSHPMGPLQLADFIGLDVCLSILQVIQGGFNSSKYQPCPLWEKLIKAQQLGVKTGKGFYVYDSLGKPSGVNPLFH